MTDKLFAAAIAATFTMTAFVATARAEAAPPTIEVQIADLDLASSDGQKELNRRIERAARQVCALDEVRTGTRLPSSAAQRCYKQALRDIHPQVAQMVRARTGA